MRAVCGDQITATSCVACHRSVIAHRAADRSPRAVRSPAALVAHHALDHALAGLGDLTLLAEPVGAVRTYLACLAPDLDGHQLGHLVIAFAADRHGAMILAPARGCTNIDLGVERGGDQLDVAQPGLGDRVERIE